MSVFERHVNRIREAELFCVWLLLLNTVKCTRVVARGDSAIVLTAVWYSIVR